MEKHNIVLVANALTQEGMETIKASLDHMDVNGSRFKISLIYVTPPVPASYMQIPSLSRIEADLESEAFEKLRQLQKVLGRKVCLQIIKAGNLAAEVRRFAKKLHTSLIISGEPRLNSPWHKLLHDLRHLFSHMTHPGDYPLAA